MRQALTVIGLSVALWLFVRSTGVHVNFLRAESGLYLEMSVSPWPEMKEFGRTFILRSYGGHFTPAAFLLELVQARVFQTVEWPWMARQMLLLGLLATAIAGLVERVSGSRLSGLAVAIVFVCQPTMIELAMWPFMGLQILCLAITAASAHFLVNFAEHRRDRDLALFLGTAYATMHVFGVGAAISASAIVTAALLVVRSGSLSLRRVVMLAAACLLTVAHVYMMRHGSASEIGSAVSLGRSLLRFGALFLESCYSGLRSVWGNGGFVWPRSDVTATQGAYGLAMLTVLASALWSLRTRPVQLALCTYALVAFCGYVTLIDYRLKGSRADADMLPFLIGGRYFIFPSFFGVLALSAFMRAGAARTASLAAAGALISSAIFFATLAPMLWPHLLVNQQARWRMIVDRAKVDQANGRSVQNEFVRGDLEFHSDLKQRRHLLEHALGCTGCIRFDDSPPLTR